MTRPDADASLSRPDDWLRERNREAAGTLFQIRHPVEPVRMRLRRLETPVTQFAHESWALLWLDSAFDIVDSDAPERATADGREGVSVRVRFSDADETIAHELFVANAAGETYVLEAWGHPEAMARTEEARRFILQSVDFPANEQEKPSEATTEQTEIEGNGWRLVLPGVDGSVVNSKWLVEHRDEQTSVVALPSHLIEGELRSESLDYPIDAVKYAETALGAKVEAQGDRHDVIVRQNAKANARTPMYTIYRFITRGERGVQIAVSTPQALYEKNPKVVDALVDSLELKATAADAEQRDDTSEK
ncbi:hypothetical protein FIV42_27865 [Persicimonas caeni]|uniref:Uncharacterized protein n=1 Tax=Persicimonas caeni TaxID=2292766 RepID=A0A4Y6Q1J3_PERCE|nr:hypothetical protein [Persicimonas caeni]QDG54423.1 hypothetical protein FIV42_27865 [Persicimonas caeni]QED35644.1 hypothetical protein FRD00_27860 [Persicimonas caeni]